MYIVLSVRKMLQGSKDTVKKTKKLNFHTCSKDLQCLLRRGRVPSVATSVHVCLFICLLARSHMSETTRPNLTKFSVHVTRGRVIVFSDGNSISYVL